MSCTNFTTSSSASRRIARRKVSVQLLCCRATPEARDAALRRRRHRRLRRWVPATKRNASDTTLTQRARSRVARPPLRSPQSPAFAGPREHRVFPTPPSQPRKRSRSAIAELPRAPARGGRAPLTADDQSGPAHTTTGHPRARHQLTDHRQTARDRVCGHVMIETRQTVPCTGMSVVCGAGRFGRRREVGARPPRAALEQLAMALRAAHSWFVKAELKDPTARRGRGEAGDWLSVMAGRAPVTSPLRSCGVGGHCVRGWNPSDGDAMAPFDQAGSRASGVAGNTAAEPTLSDGQMRLLALEEL